MTQAVSGPTEGIDVESRIPFIARHHFLFRRLHSLTGLMPVGVFLCFHLFTNAQMAFGTFQHEVEWIHSLPALLFLEIFGLWLPIAFHTVLGVAYILSGERNTRSYPYGDNWRYALQRWTAWIAMVFIFWHVSTLRWGWTYGFEDKLAFVALGPNGEPLAHPTTAMALQWGPLDGWLMMAFYILGTYASIYHFANGLWTSAITWGLTLTVKAQKQWGYVCLAVGLGLSLFAAIALYAARTYEPTEAERAAARAYLFGTAGDETITPARQGVEQHLPGAQH